MSYKRTYKIQTDVPAADYDVTKLSNAAVHAMNEEYCNSGKIEDQGVMYLITEPNIIYAWVIFDSEESCNTYFNDATAMSNVLTDKVGITVLNEINETI
jgi:hypothetical protein